jgi:sulfonate transport system substrate-binding protein
MISLSRRKFAALSLGAATAGLISSLGSRRANAETKRVRIGFQKAGVLVIVKQRATLEKRLADKGVTVSWAEFPSGPPLLEALAAGSIDFGLTGDAPPIFAQAAGTDLVYVAALPRNGAGEALIVKPDSPLKSVADLKGKRVGFTKGSSAHNFTIAAVEQAGLKYEEISPIHLSPADAAAAFANGSIDAWAIWDPFLAIAEAREKARTLINSGQVLNVSTYLLASRSFAAGDPAVLAGLIDGVREAIEWAGANRDKVAAAFAEITGVDLAAQIVAVNRAEFGLQPLTDDLIAGQQVTADRFHRLGLIPKRIVIREAVWQKPPST